MSRIVSVFLPHLPIERLKRQKGSRAAAPSPDISVPPDRPFALVGSEAHGLVLTAVNAPSAAIGLVPGMGLADARAICPHLLTLPAEPDKDTHYLLALARWAGGYSPNLNIDGSDGLWLDVTGVPHLFGGEAGLLADLARRLCSFGLSAGLALADTLGAAHALARFGNRSPVIVAPGAIKPALASLPVEALRLEQTTVLLLKRLGLKRIGQLYDLPRASLQRRFHSKDAAEAVLLRLDQALGIREETRAPLLPASRHEARLPFAEPLISHEGILAALDRIAEELCQSLARARLGARRIELRIDRIDGSSVSIETGFSAPARDAAHLIRLLTDRLQALDLGFGVDLMRLLATVTEPLPPGQTSFAETRERSSPEPLIDRLANRLGVRAVRRLHPRASHLPERAQIMKSAFARASTWTEPRPAKPPRPLLLFAKPEPLEVISGLPEGPPARFTWRHVHHRVVKAEGPERIAPEWWRAFRNRDGATNSIPPLDGEGGEAAGRAGWGERSRSEAVAQRKTPRSRSEAVAQRKTPRSRSKAVARKKSPPPGAQMRTDLPTRGRYGASGADTESIRGPKRNGSPRPRDYYRIEDGDGRRYWVFREGLYQESEAPPSWYLHGVFG